MCGTGSEGQTLAVWMCDGNKTDSVINVLLFIPPCKVAATNMSDLNKRQVSERVTVRQENFAQRKTQLLHKETDIKETPKKNL